MFRSACAMVLALAVSACAAGAAVTPNDPYYATYQWYAPTLGLPTAWGYSQGSAGVIVAVVDTGVVTVTPDLAGRVLAPLSGATNPPHDDATLGSSSILLHGTRVAGAIAMGIDNGLGGAGVGNFSILPVTVTNVSGHCSSDWIAAGIRLAADSGARVINVSLASLTYGDLNDAAAYARSKGALTFVATGNDDRRSALSGFDNLIFVSGTNRLDERWSDGAGVGSRWGPMVDLSAPADDILLPNGLSGYVLGDGTSYAAALVSGAAALIWSVNPSLTAQQVEQILFSTAVDLGEPGWDEVFGHGRIDVAAAVMAAWAIPEPAAGCLLAAGLCLLLRRKR